MVRHVTRHSEGDPCDWIHVGRESTYYTPKTFPSTPYMEYPIHLYPKTFRLIKSQWTSQLCNRNLYAKTFKIIKSQRKSPILHPDIFKIINVEWTSKSQRTFAILGAATAATMEISQFKIEICMQRPSTPIKIIQSQWKSPILHPKTFKIINVKWKSLNLNGHLQS